MPRPAAMTDADADALGDALADAGLTSRPVAVLDLDAVIANLADLRRRIVSASEGRSVSLRLASKSLRVRALIEHCLRTPGTHGVMAFTLAEALWLVRHGIQNVLVAYPVADPGLVAQLAADDRARSCVTLVADSVAHLDLISAAARGRGPVRIALELDGGYLPVPQLRIGALRSPIRTPEQLVSLAQEVLGRPALHLVGLMVYEAQVAGVGDRGGSILPRAVRAMKTRSTAELRDRRDRAVRAVAQLADLEFVNGGGTGSLETTAAEHAITEVAAGSGIIGPALFDGYHRFAPQPALHLGFAVSRRPAPRVATLMGGGWVASGPPGRDRLPMIAWPAGLAYARSEGAGEVQTPVRGRAAARLRVGDTVWLRPAKAGEAAERIDRYAVVRREAQGLRVVDVWPTYRGEGVVSP